MLRKIVLGITVFALVSAGVSAATQSGVGILDAAEQAGLNVTCPEGTANCADKNKEAQYYSTQGTQTFILRVFGGVLNFAALAAVLMLVVAAIRLVIAHGSQDKLQEAKKHIIWTLAGLAVIILSLLIVRNVTETVYEATEENAVVTSSETPPPKAVPCSKKAPSIPPACYGQAGGDLGKTQSANDNSCAAALELCADLGVSPCNMKAIQTKVAEYYDDPSASCSKADGLYGQCTEKAIENYFVANGC